MSNVRDVYAPIAEFYDLDHDVFTDDVDFYLQFVESIGDPVLELACGTGRVAVPLAVAGYQVTGADISLPMLDRARDRATEHRVDLTLTQAEMAVAHLIPGGPFGVVIMALGALSHLTTSDEQVQVLSSVRKALDSRGALLLDILHASPQRLNALDGPFSLDGTWPMPGGGTVQRFSSYSVHPAGQTIDTHIWYDHIDATGQIRRSAMQVTQRYCSPGELLLMLRAAGFEDAMFYGGYELEPFDDRSERLIVVAEATKT